MSTPIYGIDLGTTNSLIGVNGKLVSGLVPSIVDLKNKRAGESERYNMDTERGFKTDMSLSISGTMPIAASTEVLKELKRVAGVEHDKINAVISVPAYFNQSQRRATMKAASNAGINVVSLINEPTAAAIFISKGKPGIYMIFDLGGGTFDISIIESSNNGTYRVLATDGCILGGNDFDQAICNYLANQTESPWQFASDKYSMTIANEVKHEMTAFPPVDKVEKKSHVDGELVSMTKEKYVQLMKEVFSKAIMLSKAVIAESRIDINAISFYFVGGSTKCPYLRQWVQEELGIIASSVSEYNQDTVVAEGACYYAELYEQGKANELLTDISKNIGFDRGDGIMEVLITKNSNIPYSNETTHTTSKVSDDGKLTLEFYQGDSVFINDCEHIGSVTLNIKEKTVTGEAIFGVKISVSADCLMTVTCNEILGEPVEVTMKGV